jgi:hypothetical protein
VPAENSAAAITAVYEAAGDADFSVGALLDQYARAPGLIGPSYEAQQSLNERLALVGEVGPAAEQGIAGFTGAIEASKTPVVTLKGETDDLITSFSDLTAHDWTISIVTAYSQTGTPPTGAGWTISIVTAYSQTGTPPTGAGVPGLPQYQHGGVVPGRIGQAIPIIAHGGEVILNPYQYGAMGGPGGPPPPPNVSYGGDTFVNNFFNPQAAAIERERQRQRRMARLSQRL